MRTYIITAPSTPGANPTIQGTATKIKEARKVAYLGFAHRADLRWQDVRIEKADGVLVEYAGPCR